MNAKISILTFPQHWRGNQLTIRVLVMPRNFNPLKKDQVALGTPAWVDATMRLRARLVTDGGTYPSIHAASESFVLNGINMPADVRPIYEDMEQQFAPGTGITNTERLQPVKPGQRAQKYLPESYRESFNFTTPRTKDAVIDDSYQCAIRDKTPSGEVFKQTTDLSWGKVFAYCLRQPALAERVGFVYEATFAVNPLLVKSGSWIYVDLDDGCQYKPAMVLNQSLVKRYAAKLPKLKAGEDRTLFAAVQFPVLINDPPPLNGNDDDKPAPPSNFDELLIETEQYDDGFCKIVHANQPVSGDLLREKEDKELPVITDAGIRLAWDDEQLLIWMNRQLKQDETLLSGRRTDAPMGVLQYRVDVRLFSDEVINPNPWIPLCNVKNKAALMIGSQEIDSAANERELGVEVYPAKPKPGQTFWLPQYYAHWIGKSLVLPDTDAIAIFKKQENTIAEKQAKNFDLYEAAGLAGIQLLYGTKYDFRVRLADISGGGPELEDNRKYAAPSPEGFCDFRRRVQPQAVRLQNSLPKEDGVYFMEDTLTMKRPLLSYPSVLFTGQYPNAVADLIADATAVHAEGIVDFTKNRPVGLADPDVVKVEVLVEVKALEMDMSLRYDTDSHESYAKLYTTERSFPLDDLEGDCIIPISFVDAPVLNFTNSQDLGELGLIPGGDKIDDHEDIVLPKSRNVRITLRPVLDDKPGYYADGSTLHQKGKPISFITRKASDNETGLFKELAEVDTIRGIWLQPDTDTYLKATLTEVFVENNSPAHTSSMMERLTDAIDKSIEVESNGLSLVGKQGVRMQFGVSRLIRHNMSPDSTSITFSTKSDLLNQWIVPITLILNRDWTWDGAKPVSFLFHRQKKFVGAGLSEEERDAIPWEEEKLVGDIEMKQAINIQALYNSDRRQTYLCFLDAVEPKPKDAAGFPEEMMVRYRVEPQFKSIPKGDVVEVATDNMPVLQLHLPITGKPAQVPRIVSAGIAQSKYVSNDVYSSTEPRRRFLWLEFEEPLQNIADAYFIRLLAYSPDPLLAKWQFDMLKAPEEAALPINPEPIRIISPQHSDDRSGLNVMQELIPADKKDDEKLVHYLVPLPPGMHASSAELFGFLTYELRVGHKKGWSTAQARFGSALRTTGVQHPPPQLFCIVNRNEKHIMVTAPFAQTVFNGADVTSNPPRTQLWALLYAQVKRADDAAYRNILLDDQLFVRQRPKMDAVGRPLNEINSDAVQYGITGWKNKDVEEMLQEYGLPIDSALSVLTVEMLPTYDKFFGRTSFRNNDNIRFANTAVQKDILNLQEGMSISHFKNAVGDINVGASTRQKKLESERQLRMEEGFISQAEKGENIRPLTEQLGSERILRTSTLVPVPEICCTE
ncbi:MAG: hypothetical protein JWR72_1079 [Flavisolibacter sp.]|nr:hypothetical protein [Flavisolibacter sp.]